VPAASTHWVIENSHATDISQQSFTVYYILKRKRELISLSQTKYKSKTVPLHVEVALWVREGTAPTLS
jgi:hypothetical protein